MSDPGQTTEQKSAADVADEIDAAAARASHWRREQFIPLRKAELIRLLADDSQLSCQERNQFIQLCDLLAATFHYEYHRRLEELKDLYAPFNPDSVTRELRTCSDSDRQRLTPELFGKFVELLERANYERLSMAEIHRAVGAASDWGVRLNIDFDTFDRLEVFARGDIVGRRTRRSIRTRYRDVEVDVPLYQRLVVIFRLRDHTSIQREADWRRVYIKFFKNIPKQDIDMLLPGGRFKMTLADRSKIILPTLSGVAIAGYKLFSIISKGALLIAFAGVYGMLALLGLVGGTVGYGVKSFLGYLRTKDKYQLNLTRSLYYQNLDNNAGVLYRLLDEAEEQEFREAILAYSLLRRHAGADGWTEQQLDHEAEAYLSRILGFDVDFEVRDALAKLSRLNCASMKPNGHWHAVPLPEALRELDRAWDGFFRFGDETS